MATSPTPHQPPPCVLVLPDGHGREQIQLGPGRPIVWRVGTSVQNRKGDWTHTGWGIDGTGTKPGANYTDRELAAIAYAYGEQPQPTLWQRFKEWLSGWS